MRTALFASLCTLIGVPAAWSAQSSVDIGTVQATATGNGNGTANDTAAGNAPSKTPLHVSQPTSVVSKKFIQNNVVPSSNYDETVKHTPSVAAIAPNGPGLMENMGMSIRGFQDGQFNVTFDGMPWGDSNDFTHHTTSYFMSHDITQASVDRGPGTAATVGEATFGGTISLQSRDPGTTTSINPYATFGSWNTQLYGLEFDTGVMPNYHGMSALFDFEKLTSDGYLTNAGQRRENMFIKAMSPVSDETTVTVAAMYNQVNQNVPAGKSMAQIAQKGWNWGLSNDPTQENYAGYNYDNIHTDFEYIDLQSYLGNEWNLDNKLYTFGYYHNGANGNDPSGLSRNGLDTTGGGGTVIYGGAYANDAIGQKMEMMYRSVGDFFRLAKGTSIGTINMGLWYEHQYNDRYEYDVNWTLGGVRMANLAGSGAPAWNRLMHDTFDNAQPYVELAWKVTPNLTVTPGVKYAWFQRHLNATVNQKTGAPLVYTKSWSSVLPALDIHYKIQPGWVAYAQVAKGFLAPNLNTFYVTNPSASDFKPEQTWNYQVGTTWNSKRLTLSADAYYIDFNNLVGSKNVGGVTVFYNNGGVIYKGLEAEGTVYVGDGFSVYANGSVNSAKTKDTKQWVPYAPDATAAGGILYDHNGWNASLMDKYIGKSYGDVGQAYPISAYGVMDGTLGYTLAGDDAPGWLQKARINLQVNNVLDKKGISTFFGNAGDSAGTPLYWTIPERSYFVTLSAHL